MAYEIEIKMRVDEHPPVRDRLRSAGATFRCRELETNTFLDKPDSSLMNSGQGLRVRRAVNIDTNTTRCVITHKGPKKPGEMKIREETELSAGDYDDAIKLLTQLGFEVKLSFEKWRETWDLGECEVVLDELPGELGRFVEIEGPNEKCVSEMRASLGLTALPAEPRSYAAIISGSLRGKND